MANPQETLANAGANTQSAASQGTVQPAATAPAAPAAINSTVDPTVANSVPSGAAIAANLGASLLGNTAPATNTTPAASSSAPDSSSSQEGTDIFEHMSTLSNFANIEYTKFDDGGNRKIECIFVDKIKMDKDSAVYCTYGKAIKSIVINQTVTNYGFTASMVINDSNGFIQSIVNHQSNFYCVLNIMEIFSEADDILGESGAGRVESGIMPAPYIFEIEDVTSKSPDGAKEKVYSFKLIDLVSATLKKVSYGNLLIWNPAFMQSANFIDLYKTIIDFAAEIISFAHNKKYFYSNHIFFTDDITDSFNDLIKNVVLKDLPISMSCYDLLDYIYKHAAREIEPPKQFEGETVGNVLIPVLLQEENEDISSTYRNYFKRDTDKKLVMPISYSGKSSISGNMVKRGLFAKCILMPFELAFNSDKCMIYENINPIQDEKGALVERETYFEAINGLTVCPISESVDLPPSNFVVGLGWKNLSLMADTPSGGSNMLIYFNWIYEFYKAAFLNDKASAIKGKLGKNLYPSVDPHFHKMESAGLLEGDKEKFAKINSNTIVLKSTDTVKEALYHVGRALKSFIFLNALFGFKVKGNIFRHPGEIIKITNAFNSEEADSAVSSVGGAEGALAGFSLAYITSVAHIFNGNKFQDSIYASRICSVDTVNASASPPIEGATGDAV